MPQLFPVLFSHFLLRLLISTFNLYKIIHPLPKPITYAVHHCLTQHMFFQAIQIRHTLSPHLFSLIVLDKYYLLIF